MLSFNCRSYHFSHNVLIVWFVGLCMMNCIGLFSVVSHRKAWLEVSRRFRLERDVTTWGCVSMRWCTVLASSMNKRGGIAINTSLFTMTTSKIVSTRCGVLQGSVSGPVLNHLNTSDEVLFPQCCAFSFGFVINFL